MTEPVTPQRLTSGVRDEPGFVRHEHGAWCHPSADGCWELMPAPAPTPAEAATVARFDAAPDAEESLRERVARAMYDAVHGPNWQHAGGWSLFEYRTAAVAAIAVIRGDS